MSLLDNMPHKATIRIRSRTKDTMGGAKDSFTTVSTDVPCWRQTAKESEIIEFQKRDIVVTDKIYFPSDPGIDERHSIVINGDILSVRSRAHPDASAGKGVVWRIFVLLEDW